MALYFTKNTPKTNDKQYENNDIRPYKCDVCINVEIQNLNLECNPHV